MTEPRLTLRCEWGPFAQDFASEPLTELVECYEPSAYGYRLDQFTPYQLCRAHIAQVLTEYAESVAEGLDLPPAAVYPL